MARPALKLVIAADRAQLEIDGQVGSTYEVQTTLSLNVINWVKAQSVTLTNLTQVVELPLGRDSTSFWRVRLESPPQ